MPTAKINIQTIYFEDSGGHGPAIIFSHGLLMDHEMFEPQIEALHDHYRVIIWDARGHGKTGDADMPFSYYDSAQDLCALMQYLGIEKAVLAGMSQGGYVSLRAALQYPEIAEGLILMDTQAKPEDPSTLPMYTQMVKTWASEGLSDEMAATIENIILGAGYADAAKWKARWKSVTPANLLQIFETLVTRDDITRYLERVKVPSLVIHGDADNAIPLAHAQDMAKHLAKSKLVVIPGAGHAANLTHASAVNPHIERFLDKLTRQT